MNCCQDKNSEIVVLPFIEQIWLDFYDGPLEGFTICSKCKQCFYFKLVEWDIETQCCRIFRFVPVEMDFVETMSYFNEWSKNIRCCTDDSEQESSKLLAGFREIATLNQTTNICVSDDYFSSGLWYHITENDSTSNQWMTFFNIVPDSDGCRFILLPKHSVASNTGVR